MSFTVCVFVCLFVCTVTYFSAEDKAIGIKFCTAVYRRSIFVNFAPPEAQNRTNPPARHCCNVMLLGFCDSHACQVRVACGRRIGMCGYTAVPEDGRTCFLCHLCRIFNVMLKHTYLSREFGRGIVILPVKDKHGNLSSSDNYGIEVRGFQSVWVMFAA